MSTLRVALFQMDTAWHDKEKNLHAVSRVAKLAKGNADLLVLPEMFTTGFSMAAQEFGEELKKSLTVKRLCAIAKESNVAIAGSIIEKHGKKFYNTAIVVSKTGKLLSTYRKINLFPLSKEHKTYSSGASIATFELEKVKCGVAICYDLRFPELFRELARKGAKVIFVPANWPSLRAMHWLTLLRARAIENQLFVAGINRVGDDRSLHYGGNSVIFGAWGEEVASATAVGEEIIFAKLDFTHMEKIRREYPFLNAAAGEK